MEKDLQGKKVAILATDGVEQDEMLEPKKALEKAGAKTYVVSPKADEIKCWKHTDWGKKVAVDLTLDEARASEFDALVLPGGVMNPDKLRTIEKAQKFVRAFVEQHKPVAAICHGPWLLINAGVARGRKMTSYSTIRLDLENAGAHWVDEEVVIDDGVITSRSPADIPAFSGALMEAITLGVFEHLHV